MDTPTDLARPFAEVYQAFLGRSGDGWGQVRPSIATVTGAYDVIPSADHLAVAGGIITG